MTQVAQLDIRQAKERALLLYAAGASVEKAMAASGRALRTWESWRKNDKHFAAQADTVRVERVKKRTRVSEPETSVDVPPRRDMDFVQFRKEYLGSDTYRHQQAWVDVIEGKDYEPIEGETFIAGRSRKRVLINTPPFHAKSTVITMDYATYRICMNPNIRIVIVSKTEKMAKKFLYGIKQRLTSHRFVKLQAAFGPPDGFKGKGAWSTTQIYVSGQDSGEKDPTVEAVGVGGHIYGQRADLIILDDVADLKNFQEFEKQIGYIQQDVNSRLLDGLLIVVGTRVGPQDLYSEIMDGDRYLSGTSPWTHLAQPAVFHFDEDPNEWVTLWPRSSKPLDEEDTNVLPDGTYRAWDGPRLSEIRDSVKPATWALVYQQQSSLGTDATFDPLLVWSAVNRVRKPGPLAAGAWGHPRHGGEGMFTIASMDPAMSGETFTIVGKVDRATKKRWIENAWVKAAPPASYFRDHIKQVTVEHNVNEWVIEEQGFQGFLVHDPEIRAFLATRGVRMTGHYTGKNKLDPDFGVASLSTLFGTSRRINEGAGRTVFDKGSNFIELPDPEFSPGLKALIEELLMWEPGKRGSKLRQDGPMALWFFETRARIILGHDRQGAEQKFVNLPFQARGMKAKQVSTSFPFLQRRVV